MFLAACALGAGAQARPKARATPRAAAPAAEEEASGASAPRVLTLNSDDALPRERWIYGVGTRPENAGGAVGALVEAKRAEVEEKWLACASAAPRARAMAKSIAPWIDALELRCALAAASDARKPSSAPLKRALDGIDRRAAELSFGPQAPALRSAYAQAALAAFEADSKTDRARAWASFERVEKAKAWLDEKQKARAFRAAGELSFLQQRLEAARTFLKRSLDAQTDQPDARARLQSIEAALARGAPEAASGEAPPAKPDGDARADAPTKETELVDRATEALKKGDLVSASDDLATLLKEFPGGSRAKWAADRMQEAYMTVAEKDSGDREGGRAQARAQIVKRMLEVDAERRIDWARNMNARGFYEDGLKVAKAAAESLRGSARAGRALETALASAMSSEKWRDAREVAQDLMERHSGTTAARDAYVRSAQAAYRMKDYPAAAAVLERLLAAPQSDNVELSARHLLWRALQKTNSPRAGDARDALISRFPFSYYGLRARADRDGALEPAAWVSLQGAAPTSARIKTRIVDEEPFSGEARAGLERATLLLRAGWLEEAAAELRDLPPPQSPKAKAVRSRYHAAALDYQTASRLVNDAWDADPTFRRDPFIRVGFPLEFIPFVEKEAKARGLEKWLALGLIKQESAFNPRAQSSSNARGLMQMIPPTAREIADDLNIKNLELPRDLERPSLNVRMGAYYISKMIRKYQGNVPLALAAYNAGPGRIDRWLKSRPSLAGLAQLRSSAPDDELWFDEIPWSETCFYVKAILRNALIYRALDQGRVEIGDPAWAAPARTTPQ